jgi:hypothetical protein
MRRHWVVSTIILIAVVIGSFKFQYAQNSAGDSDLAKQNLAVNLLRAINTAERAYHQNHGAFTSWATLATSDEFTKTGMKWAARHNPQLAKLRLSSGPDILPGWKLRLDLTSDRNGYDVLLEDAADKSCGYAALTDERGVIRQSKTIDCKI